MNAGNERRLLASGLLSLLIGGGARSASGLTINLTYDSTVTSLSYASSVETATNYAAQQLENVLTNNITINIDVQVNANAFGGSSTGLGGIYSYSDIRNDLTASATTPVDSSAVAMMNALPDPTQGGNFWIPGAEMKALGLSAANGTGNDGTFTFGTNNPWNFSTTARSVSGEYDFVGVALHELTECMGRTSVLGGNLNNQPGWIPFDLFRFVQPGWESTNNHDNGVYFSVDQGNTNLKNYNPASNGGDLQDWATGTPDAADQASVQGTENDLSPADIATLDAIGYTPVTAPRTLVWDGSSNGLDTTHWLNGGNNVPAYIGATLSVGSGTVTYEPPDVASNLVLSSSSIYGMGLTITGGTVQTVTNNYVSGLGTGRGAGLYLNSGSTLSISGSGQLKLAGALVIGGDTGGFINATITGGSITVGEDTSSDVDPTLYIGLSGNGSLTQSGSSIVTTTNLIMGSNSGSSGTYTISNGTLTVSGVMILGGTSSGIGGTGNLTFNSGTLSASSLTIWQGAFVAAGHTTISGATLDNARIQVPSGNATFGSITGTGQMFVGSNNVGIGLATVSAPSITQWELQISSTGTVSIPFGTPTTSVIQYLVVTGNGTLDLTDNTLDLNYGTNGSPVSLIRSLLISGRNDGRFNHPGITSSTAANVPHHSTALGYIDTGTDVLVKYTWYGDANLDGVVNSMDLSAIQSNGTSWATGDFNYDGKVNADDYTLLMLGAAASAGANISTTLPEPSAIMVVFAGGLALNRLSPRVSRSKRR